MCAGGNSEANRWMVPEPENPNPRTTYATCKIHVCLRFGPQTNSVFSMQGGWGGADPMSPSEKSSAVHNRYKAPLEHQFLFHFPYRFPLVHLALNPGLLRPPSGCQLWTFAAKYCLRVG